MKVDKPKYEEIHKVAGHLFELTGCSDQIKPGSCLRCGSGLDLDTSYATIEETGPWSKRYIRIISLEILLYFFPPYFLGKYRIKMYMRYATHGLQRTICYSHSTVVLIETPNTRRVRVTSGNVQVFTPLIGNESALDRPKISLNCKQ